MQLNAKRCSIALAFAGRSITSKEILHVDVKEQVDRLLAQRRLAVRHLSRVFLNSGLELRLQSYSN
jgi:hypothetical protein